MAFLFISSHARYGLTMPELTLRNERNCRRTAGSNYEPRRRRVDGGEGERLWSGGRSGSSLRPVCGRCGPTHAIMQRKAAPQAVENQAHQHKHFASIRLPAFRWQTWVFRISVSMRRLDRLPCRPRQALACSLRAGRASGIDLPAGLWAACGLNSRQINHLQHVASETHYRGQSACPHR
jgi:hypothetical protein